MARKKKSEPNITYKCGDCGYIPEPNKEKSNENWTVIDLNCPECGGRIKMDFSSLDS
jgi:DNA-directed RNA polymerase subunit RPC12/RpoP